MLIPSIAALAMGVASCVLFYTDHRLNQAGIASPRGFGDGIVGLVSLCLQPWLIIFGRSGAVQLSTWSLAQFVALGGVSGTVFAVIVLMPLARWQGITTALTIVLFVIALACGVYATLNFNTLNKPRNRPDQYGASSQNGQNKTDAGNDSYGICRVIDISRSPSPDPKRSFSAD